VTSRDDYLDEMLGRHPIDDATAEDLFAGRPVPADLEPLPTAVRALREVSRQPVLPSPRLAALMAAGTVAARPLQPGRAAGLEIPRAAWRTAAGLTAAVGRASLAAKLAAAGGVVAVLGFGSAGFAGSLPQPVQDRFETVVESVVPYQFPDRATGATVPAGPDPGPPGGAGPRGAGHPEVLSPAGGDRGSNRSLEWPPAGPNGGSSEPAGPGARDQGAGDRARGGAGPDHPPAGPPIGPTPPAGFQPGDPSGPLPGWPMDPPPTGPPLPGPPLPGPPPDPPGQQADPPGQQADLPGG
jgi:hypothetical protein